MFQLNKPLSIENHKLLIPEDHKPKTPRDIIAVENSQFERNIKPQRETSKDDTISFNPEDESNDLNIPSDLMKEICDVAFEKLDGEQVRNTRKDNMKRVNTIADFGEFPTSMDMLEQCPNDKNHLCLNMLGDEVPGKFHKTLARQWNKSINLLFPAFTVKIRLPFRENMIMHEHTYFIRITNIVTDATTKGALQVSVTLINEGFESDEFHIFITSCPMTCGAQTIVKKMFVPHIGDIVSFLLPLDETAKRKHLKCKGKLHRLYYYVTFC